jgi:hypothetical protein
MAPVTFLRPTVVGAAIAVGPVFGFSDDIECTNETALRPQESDDDNSHPSLLERRRRVDQALFAVVMEAYLHGVCGSWHRCSE